MEVIKYKALKNKNWEGNPHSLIQVFILCSDITNWQQFRERKHDDVFEPRAVTGGEYSCFWHDFTPTNEFRSPRFSICYRRKVDNTSQRLEENIQPSMSQKRLC